MDSAERKAANEAMYRQVNEQIVGLEERFSITDGERLSIVCECDRMECAEIVQVWHETYERVRAQAACFVVLAGHVDASIEDVVESGDGYVVVRKRPGAPRRVAVETDPRS
jgi:hypothetical protein